MADDVVVVSNYLMSISVIDFRVSLRKVVSVFFDGARRGPVTD